MSCRNRHRFTRVHVATGERLAKPWPCAQAAQAATARPAHADVARLPCRVDTRWGRTHARCRMHAAGCQRGGQGCGSGGGAVGAWSSEKTREVRGRSRRAPEGAARHMDDPRVVGSAGRHSTHSTHST